ncbi:MAG: NAD(P)-binding domain-containing protein [Candidatus Pseudobacter hemicellulosilyticus]|uniref:NAD(P)-binding domain-containing protein n=1 Tax=Candidatus Pseudobacter hemicellulosilyticus TaxID=3121375 RepID=A0AAJ5WY29_9BACT|nr:MAG: NAD(P)-binding domain-containing protein [Pseudobacter sp.]
MKIGILGAGNVGRVLGKGLLDAGHSVLISNREPQSESLFTWKEQLGAGCHTGTFAEAAAFGDVIIIAINWNGVQELLQGLGAAALKDKIVIDLCNAVSFSETPQLALKGITAGELVQQWLPDSKVVKTLNMVGASRMVNPSYAQGIPTMFLCGNDAGAKQQVTTLLEALGWKDNIDLGDISRSNLLESLMLTCLIAELQLKTFNAAFSLLR